MNEDQVLEVKKVPPIFTDPLLREAFANELTEMEVGMEDASDDEKFWVRFGMESAFWALQKQINLGMLQMSKVEKQEQAT